MSTKTTNLCGTPDCPNRTEMDLETPWGKVKNVPPMLLGWVLVGALLVFLVWKVTGSFEANLNAMAKEMPKQTILLQRILDKH